MAKPMILFVEDDLRELERLRKLLGPVESRWEIRYSKNGYDALSLVKKIPCHVVVSDLEMPGMDGTQLLTEVMRSSPHTIRFLRVDPNSRQRVLRTIGVSHQLLSKSDTLEQVTTAITRAMGLRSRLQADSLRQAISRIGVLPSLPLVYGQLVKAMENADVSLNEIGEIIEQDLGMSAKILQLINSSLYGLRDKVGSITQAVSLLGVDVIKNMLIWFHLGAQFTAFQLPGLMLSEIQRHSLLCGRFAQAIADRLGFDDTDCSNAFIAGMFHELGILVLANADRAQYLQAMHVPADKRLGMAGGEYKVLGTSHAEVGAYLLALWGFHDQIVEACCYHHNPQWQPNPGLGLVAVTYLADILAHQQTPGFDGNLQPQPDYLRKVGGLDQRLAEFAALCKEVV